MTHQVRGSIWIVGGTLGLCVALGVAQSEAASGNAVVYKVTVTMVEASTDGGSTYISLFEGSQEIDIASVTAGAVAAGLVTGKDIPDGTYNTIRATTAAAIMVKGYVNILGSTWYTDGGVDTEAFTNIAGEDNTTASDYSESTFNIGIQSEADTGLSIVHTAAKPAIVTVTFDTSAVIINSGNSPSVGEPTVTLSSR